MVAGESIITGQYIAVILVDVLIPHGPAIADKVFLADQEQVVHAKAYMPWSGDARGRIFNDS